MKVTPSPGHRYMKKGLAVILIDMQDFFLNNFSSATRNYLINEQSKILDLCVNENIPLVVFEYKAGGVNRGKTTPKLEKKIRKISQEIIIKENNSAFTKTHLDKILKGLKVKRILLMGINANGCVQDTAIAAIHRGYKVITSSELMASASVGKLGLSKRNIKWYAENTDLFENERELMSYLKND